MSSKCDVRLGWNLNLVQSSSETRLDDSVVPCVGMTLHFTIGSSEESYGHSSKGGDIISQTLFVLLSSPVVETIRFVERIIPWGKSLSGQTDSCPRGIFAPVFPFSVNVGYIYILVFLFSP